MEKTLTKYGKYYKVVDSTGGSSEYWGQTLKSILPNHSENERIYLVECENSGLGWVDTEEKIIGYVGEILESIHLLPAFMVQ